MSDQTLKHLAGQHNQKKHGSRGGVKVSNEAISGLDKQVQAHYDGLSEGDKVKFRLAWYRETKKNPSANSFDFMQQHILKQNPGIHSTPLDTKGKNTREKGDITGMPKPGTKEYDDDVMKLVSEHNAMVDRNGYNGLSKYGYPQNYSEPIRFQTTEQAHAWLEEYSGQMTDGKYENHRVNNADYGMAGNGRGKWTSGRSSPASRLYATKIIVDPSKPPSFPQRFTEDHKLSFRDLNWLFDKQHGNAAYGGSGRSVRDIFSNMSDAQVKTIAAQITAAIQGKVYDGSH